MQQAYMPEKAGTDKLALENCTCSIKCSLKGAWSYREFGYAVLKNSGLLSLTLL